MDPGRGLRVGEPLLQAATANRLRELRNRTLPVERIPAVAILRIPRLYGAQPGDVGYVAGPALREMKKALAAARDRGAVSVADARAEREELEKAERHALEHGRAPIGFSRRNVIAPVTKNALARKKARKAQRQARKRARR